MKNKFLTLLILAAMLGGTNTMFCMEDGGAQAGADDQKAPAGDQAGADGQAPTNASKFLKFLNATKTALGNNPKKSLGALTAVLGTDLYVRNRKLFGAMLVYLNPLSDKEDRAAAKARIAKVWNSGKMGKAACFEFATFILASGATVGKCAWDGYKYCKAGDGGQG